MTTNPYEQTIGQLRAQLKKFIAEARHQANRIWRQESTPNHRKIAIAMWLKSIESCEATDLLASREMYGAAWATLRVAYECLFYSCAVLVKPANSSKLGEHHMYQVAKLLKDRITDKVEANERSEEQKKAIAKSDEVIRKFANWPAAMAAKDAGLFEHYTDTYRSISQLGAHANISSLDQHLAQAMDRPMRRGGRPGDRNSQINLAILCVTLGLERHGAGEMRNDRHQ